MQIISNFLILAGVFITPFLNAQSTANLPENHVRYSSPIDIPMLLSGNYGEIRTARFHTGIDIKTDQVEGKNILAARDGYVYRIVVGSGGYGKAVYLKHADGQVTVYAHMQQFAPVIGEFVKKEQYRRKSFEVDLNPTPEQFVFQQGEFLGFSGNTGNSESPHLHFEIRDAASVPLNALDYGLDIKDETRPRINWLAVYPLDLQSTVNGVPEKLMIPVSNSEGNPYLKTNNLQVSGHIGLGIETYDYLDNSANKCSPYTISMTLDKRPVFFCRIDSIPFSMSAYVNSHIDYEEKARTGKNIQKMFVDPNNKLGIYKLAVNRGILTLKDTLKHTVEIRVTDTYGNESALSFTLQGSIKALPPVFRKDDPTLVGRFRYDTLNLFEDQDIRIVIPRDALFDHLDFHYVKMKNDSCPWSLLHQVQNEYTPLAKPYILSIRGSNLPSRLQAKAVIASRGKNGDWVSQGGTYKNGFVTASIKSFGKFFIAVDTLNPLITPVAFKAGDRYTSGQVLSFTIADSQSGIRKYNGYVDNRWTLFEYDAKNDLLIYTLDESRLDKNKTHDITIIVTDNKDNTTVYNADFFY
jgi:hypothetical protein